MDKSNHLPIGSVIAHKYEIIDTLGEDEFEILYLVRDLERKKTFFVLKELFLESFSHRENLSVATISEARGVFKKQKEQIIQEIESQKQKVKNSDIRIYGYEEDNQTIYTVMEYSNNASLERYLHYFPKDTASLPTLEKLLKKDRKSKKPILLVAGLAFLGMLGGMASYYGYDYYQKNNQETFLTSKEFNSSKVLRENVAMKIPSSTSQATTVEKEQKKVVRTETKAMSPHIESVKETSLATVAQKVPKRAMVVAEKNVTVLSSTLPVASVLDTTTKKPTVQDEKVAVTENVGKEAIIEKSEKVKETKKVVVKKVAPKKVEIKNEKDMRKPISAFLTRYMNAIAKRSSHNTLKYYDKRLKRYFRFKNASRRTIQKSQERYNKSYPYREFKISDFKILKQYRRKGTDYFDLKTTTKWRVKDKKGKWLTGKSRGLMTIKKVRRGFEITTIYAKN